MTCCAATLHAQVADTTPGNTVAWISGGLGVTGTGGLAQGSLWISPGRLAFGIRRSGMTDVPEGRRLYRETGVLIGLRLPRKDRTLVAFGAGLAKNSGAVARGDCFLFCGPTDRMPLPTTIVPTIGVDYARTHSYIGIGFSGVAVAGHAKYVGGTISLFLGQMPLPGSPPK